MARTIGLCVLLLSTASWADGIPAPLASDDFLLDQAGLIVPSQETHLRALQQTADQYGAPLVVVTIARASAFGERSVDALATRWFNTWDIGTRGILLLVSVEDRRARIELGSEWGHDWDAHAKWIMDDKVVSRFKSGNFSGGILDGAEALLEMAKAGPQGQIPGSLIERKLRPVSKYSLLDPPLMLGLAALGVALILYGAFSKTHSRGLFIGVGVALVLVAFVTWIAVGAFVVLFGRRRRSSWFGTDSWGGGGGGGSSGGGGASGSW